MGCGPSSGSGSDKEGKKSDPTDLTEKVKSTADLNCSSQTHHQKPISMKAAILIQNWYRRYRARLEARRRATWMIYQSIEYSGEQDQLRLYNFFNDMLSLTNKDGAENKSAFTDAFNSSYKYHQQSIEEEDQELYELTDYKKINVESSYKGPHLTFPLTSSHLKSLIEHFKNGEHLHARYLLQLLHETRNLLKTKPNVSRASTSISKQITVCGDLHGKMDDLLVVFYKNGLPDVSNPYIFNGDFVDRGPHSIEVAALLFACLLVNPNVFFLNRGNHEDHVMNYRYGFIKEIQAKYKGLANKLVRLFGDVFSWLPLATIIDNSILVCHGGVSDKLDLDKLEGLDRHKYLSALRPPVEGEDDKIDFMEWRQVLDILWSDPKAQNGCKPNTFRGGGSYFGPDITNLVLKKLNLNLIIRSHECKLDGWEYCHDNKVLTVFSASNYYEDGSNRGAYVRLDSNHRAQIVQYMATKSRKLTFNQRVSQIEMSAMRDLRAKIVASKSELTQRFAKVDATNSGFVKLSDWCSILEDVMQLALPWRTLRYQFAKTNKEGLVDYMSTFQQAAVTSKYHEGGGNPSMGGNLTEQLYKHRDNLETIFRIIDKDNSGYISLEEFQDACRVLSKATKRAWSDQTIQDMAQTIDINKDGCIDFNEFLEAFRIVDHDHHAAAQD